MGAERLTSLEAVKSWLGITTSDSDTQIGQVIDAASQFVLRYMDRSTLMRATHTQRFIGNGKSQVLLGNWPVLSVTSVGIGSSVISASTFSGASIGPGYRLSEDKPSYRSILLTGYAFCRGTPAEVTYVSGFETSEANTIPSTPREITPTTGGDWSVDRGVTIDGVDATEVTSSPAAGQYAVDASGKYTFAAADVGKTAIITYGYVPYDIAFAVTEIVGEWYKRKDRIGVASKSLSGGVGESVTFTSSAITPAVSSVLQPYVNVAPL